MASQDRVSGSVFEVTLDLLAGASYGPRDVIFRPPEDQGEPVRFPLQVNMPAPALTGLDGSPVRQDDAGAVLRLFGAKFRKDGEVSFSGSGVTVASVQVVSDAELLVTVDVDLQTPPEPRDVTYCQPLLGGGETASLEGVLAVDYPAPRPLFVTRLFGIPGEDVHLELHGSHFRHGLEVEGTGGLSVINAIVGSDELVLVDAAIDAGAVQGRNCTLVLTQDPAHGGAAATLDPALRIETGARLESSERVYQFGGSVCRDGDRVAAGARIAETVVVFEHGSGGWVETGALTPPDGAPDDHFGTSVALAGDVLLVGAPQQDGKYEEEGAVYTFVWTGEGWEYEGKTKPSQTRQVQWFGDAIAWTDGFYVIGAPGRGSGQLRERRDLRLREAVGRVGGACPDPSAGGRR